MKTPARFTAYFLLAVGIFAAGYLAIRQHDPAVSPASDKQKAGYICPMHSQYKSDRNGTCPICGMSLVPASAGPSSERVVVSGNFLIDSETRMKLASYDNSTSPASEKKKVKDPVCGMEVDPKAKGTLKSEYQGKTFYFCSKLCKKSFDAKPEDYVHKAMAGPDTSMAQMPK